METTIKKSYNLGTSKFNRIVFCDQMIIFKHNHNVDLKFDFEVGCYEGWTGEKPWKYHV